MPEPILDVDRRPTQLEVRQQEKHVALFFSGDPSAAMKEYQRRVRTRSVLRQIQIELELDVAGLRVRDVGKDVVLAVNVVDPAIGIRLAESRSADYTDYADQKSNLRNLWIGFVNPHASQKLSRLPNRHCRNWFGPYVEVIKPKVALLMSDCGFAKLAWFVALSASARNCNLTLSEKLNVRYRLKSVSKKPGPRSVRSEERRVGKECRSRWA